MTILLLALLGQPPGPYVPSGFPRAPRYFAFAPVPAAAAFAPAPLKVLPTNTFALFRARPH